MQRLHACSDACIGPNREMQFCVAPQEWIQDNCPWNLAKKSEKAKRRMESEKADEADAINALASLKRRG